jgi:hypothetical protein
MSYAQRRHAQKQATATTVMFALETVAKQQEHAQHNARTLQYQNADGKK